MSRINTSTKIKKNPETIKVSEKNNPETISKFWVSFCNA